MLVAELAAKTRMAQTADHFAAVKTDGPRSSPNEAGATPPSLCLALGTNSGMNLLWSPSATTRIHEISDLESLRARVRFGMPQVDSVLKPTRLYVEHAYSNFINLIKPSGKDASVLCFPAMQIGSAYRAITLTELKLDFWMRAP
jgi:hypothetical protein